MSKRVTLGDLAKAAGLSRAAVSMALRDMPKISASTRARVQELAEKMGYRPDPALAALAAMRWPGPSKDTQGRPLALVTGKAPDRPFQIGEQLAIIAQQRGFKVEPFDRRQFASDRALSRVLYNRGIRGVFLGLVEEGMPPWDLQWDLFSVVALVWPEYPCPFHSVAADMFAAVVLAFRETRRHGYRRIGLAPFQSVPHVSFDPLRIAAARLVEEEIRPRSERIPPLTAPGDNPAAFREWIERHRPDAVVALSPGQLWWLRDAGYRVPEDMGFAAILHAQPGFCAGCREMRPEVCEAALDLMDSLLRHGRRGIPPLAQTLLVEPCWIDGPTLRPLSMPESDAHKPQKN